MTTTRAIRRLLIANRGEIARRVLRTAHDMGISTVAVYADDDRDAPFVREADMAVALRGSSATETYLDVSKIIEAAHRTGSDAIHPGYGFLSESDALAEACDRAGMVFVGPSPDALRTMGLKDVAKSVARQAGIPVLPDAVLEGDDENDWVAAATGVGFPLLVKATAGGGGKGMRLVERPDDLVEAVTAARREAASSFGNPAVFIERYLARARHVEVQVFGDRHGGAIHLFERECSVQRRHQKVVEESPAPMMTPELRERMTEASVELVRHLGYVGAGTVEYLVEDPIGDDVPARFFFLEMNTRLQVEHPVTEAVTGLDLVRMQLEVAAGKPMPVRQQDVRLEGHAIEVRLCAEDPAEGYRPTPGPMHRFQHPAEAHLRFEDALADSGTVSPFFDPMIAKVIAWAPDRHEAAARLARSLGRTEIHGVMTNRDQLLAVLRDDDFLAGRIWTGYLEARPDLAHTQLADRVVHLAAATVASIEARAADLDLGDIESGWRSLPHSPLHAQTWRDVHRSSRVETRYRWTRNGLLTIEIVGAQQTMQVDRTGDGTVDVILDGLLQRCRVAQYADGSWWVTTPFAQSGWMPEPRFTQSGDEVTGTAAVVQMPGTVVVVDVKEGDKVRAGQRLLVLEAMKMEHPVTADRDGIVAEVRVRIGDVISPPSTPVILEEVS